MLIWETIKFLAVDLVASIIYFPVWWYTAGMMKVARLVSREVKSLMQTFNLKVLFQSLFIPMFGQYDLAGRIISFFVRIVYTSGLFVISVVYTTLLSVLLLLWLLLPIFILYNFLFHLGVNFKDIYAG